MAWRRALFISSGVMPTSWPSRLVRSFQSATSSGTTSRVKAGRLSAKSLPSESKISPPVGRHIPPGGYGCFRLACGNGRRLGSACAKVWPPKSRRPGKPPPMAVKMIFLVWGESPGSPERESWALLRQELFLSPVEIHAAPPLDLAQIAPANLTNASSMAEKNRSGHCV